MLKAMTTWKSSAEFEQEEWMLLIDEATNEIRDIIAEYEQIRAEVRNKLEILFP